MNVRFRLPSSKLNGLSALLRNLKTDSYFRLYRGEKKSDFSPHSGRTIEDFSNVFSVLKGASIILTMLNSDFE